MTVHLLWGEDPFLLREAALEVLGPVRATEVEASEWRGGELQDLATPSLLGEPRALMVNDARSLGADALAELAAYLEGPDPEATLIVCCRTAERGKPPAALLKLVERAGEARRIHVARKDLEAWLVSRARSGDVDLAPPAARALVATIGEDSGALAAALEQMADAFAGQRLTPDMVGRQFRGLGDQKTWDLCDRAFGKDLPGAIRSLQAVDPGGDEALKVLGGIASRLRDLMRVRALPDRMAPSDVAKQAGLRFEWQGRRYRQQAQNFSMSEMVRLHDLVVEADRALKSGATGGVVMPMLVTAIAAHR